MRKHLFCNFGLPILVSKNNQPTMFLQTPFLVIFLILFRIFQKWWIWGPLQNLVGAKTEPTIDHFWKIGENKDAQRLRYRLDKHKYEQKRQVDWTFVFYLISRFYIFQFERRSCQQIHDLFICSLAPNTSRNIKRMGPPKSNSRQREANKKPRESIRSALFMYLASTTWAV